MLRADPLLDLQLKEHQEKQNFSNCALLLVGETCSNKVQNSDGHYVVKTLGLMTCVNGCVWAQVMCLLQVYVFAKFADVFIGVVPHSPQTPYYCTRHQWWKWN